MEFIRKLWLKDKLFYQTVLGIAIPIALQSLITTGVNMMDTIMIGVCGETELSAVSLANQFIMLFQGLCMGIGMGASVLVSRFYGMKNQDALRKTLAIMLRLCLGIAGAFMLATSVGADMIMRIYTNDPAIAEQGVIYLRYSIPTFLLLGTSLTSTIVLRNVEKVRMPLVTSIGAFFVNVVGNYVLIFGKFGFPEMGVAGAALGTLFARSFECFIICGYLFFRDQKIGFRMYHLFMKVGNIWKEYMKISIPVLISDTIFSLGNSAVAMVIGRLGENFVAANAITSVTQQLTSVLTQGVAQASATVTGYTLGRGEREKAFKQGYAFLGFGIMFGVLTSLAILVISEPIIGAYQVSSETADIARQLMRAISLTILFQAINSIMTKGTLRGGGDTKILMLTDNIFLWIVALPLGLLAGFVLQLPAFWIYVCIKSDQILKAVWCVFRLQSGKWIKKISAAEQTT